MHLADLRRLLVSIALLLTGARQMVGQPPATDASCATARRGTGADSLALLDSTVAEAVRRNGVPGAVLAVVREGRVVLLRGYGCADAERDVAADPERTVFRIASVSKLVVATAVMQLVERGEVALDGDVNRYLRDLRVPEAPGGPVTLHALLTHTAGFDERAIGYAARTPADIRPLGEFLRRRLPARGWPPGLHTGYSNFGYALAGYLVEAVSGEPFTTYATRHVFEPLGMISTTYEQPLPPALAARAATGYRCTPDGCTPLRPDYRSAYPPGGVVTTAADMTRFMRAHLDGVVDDVRLIADSTRRVMHAQQFTNDPSLPGMAYGFAEETLRGHRALSHAGGSPGVLSLLMIVPDRGFGVFLVANGGATRFGREALAAVSARLVDSMATTALTQPRAAGATADPTGAYRLTRYAHSTVENLPMLFAGQLSVDRLAGDTVLVGGLGDASGRYVPVDRTHWRRESGDATIAVRVDERGRVTHLFGPLSYFGTRFPAAFERLRWYDGAHVVNEALSWLLLVPVIVLLALWPAVTAVQWLLRRRAMRAGRVMPLASVPRRWRWAAIAASAVVSVLTLVFGFGFIAQTVRAVARGGGELIYGMPGRMAALLWMPWAIALLALPLVLALVFVWRRRWWGLPGRVFFTALALDAAALTWMLAHWSYLPAAY